MINILYMSCDIKLTSPIYRVIYTSLVNKSKKIYIFVGEINDKDINNILKKVQFKNKLTVNEINTLKNCNIENLYKIVFPYTTIKNKEDIIFINDRIRDDDTINTLKKKIFINLSNVRNNEYIVMNNQCLWMDNKDNESKILGYYYNNIEINPKDIYKTSFSVDSRFIRDDGSLKKLDFVSINYDLIGDFIKNNNIEKYKIYLLNATDIYEYLLSKQRDINESMINGFFKKYFPKFGLVKTSIANILYEKVNIINKYHNYVFNLLDKTPIDNNEFGCCAITTIKFNTNIRKIKDKYQQENIQLDLFKIFYYLTSSKEFDYSKMPLIKYKNPKDLKGKGKIFVWKGLKTLINIDLFKSWVNLKKKDREYILKQSSTSIQIKKLYKYIDETPIFYTLIIWDKGNITVQVSFKETHNATFIDINNICNDCIELLDKINKNVELIKNMKFKLIAPEIFFNNGVVSMNDFTYIDYFNNTTIFDIKSNIDLKKFGKYLENFNFIINYKLNKNVIINSINLKYNRVSNYIDMDDIMMFINEKKIEGIDDIEIIKDISDKYDKINSDSTELLKKWKMMYGLQKKKGEYKYNSGISLDIYENKFTVSGVHIPIELKRIYNFCCKIINIFTNQNKYKSDKEYQAYIVEKKINFIKLEEELNNKKELEIEQDINNYDEEYNNINNINDYYNNKTPEEYIENDITNDENLVEEESNKAVYDNSLIETQLRLDIVCKDDEKGIDYKHDTCSDLCNDNKYFLRRLHRYASDLYFYKLKRDVKKIDDSQYSRSCQSGFRQPVILNYDPRLRDDIDQSAYKNVLHYPSNKKLYYICPDAWCPYHEKPVSRTSLPNIEIKQGVNGACIIANCPYGDHKIYVKKPWTLKDDKDNYYNYVGFIDKSKTSHPSGDCQICCYKKDQNIFSAAKYDNYKLCLGEEVDDKDDLQNNIYILSSGIPLRNNKFGLLSDTIYNVLGNKCIGGYIDKKVCFLRKGIKQNLKQSFLYCIADLFMLNKVNINNFKKALVNSLNFTETLFKSLNNGMLVKKFDDVRSKSTPFENYKNFLLENEHEITYEYIWDLLQRPGILLTEGLNIIIFTKNYVICPYKEDINQYYDINRPSIMLYTDLNYYEPIYLVDGNMKKKDYIWIFSSQNYERMPEIIENIKRDCKHYYDIDLRKILEDEHVNENMNVVDNLIEQHTLKETLDKLSILPDDYQLDFQVLDYNNKISSIFLKNGVYLPVKPSPLMVIYDYILSDDDNIKYLDYITTKKHLEFLYKNNFKTKPVFKILDLHRKNIVGIMVNTGRKIQVSPSKYINDNLRVKDISFFSNVNRAIHNEVELYDDRKEYIIKKNYEDENFIRLKYEISNYINESYNKNIKSEIIEIINSTSKLGTKRTKLKKLLLSIVKTLVIFENIKFNILDYINPNRRVVCYKNNNCNDIFHCKKIDNETCKLLVNKNNLITGKSNKETYLSILIEDLLRYENKRLEILNNLIDNIIDKDKITVSPDLLDFSSNNPKKLNEEVEKYFTNKNELFISEKKLYDEIETLDYDINREKYILYKKDNEIELYIEPLIQLWETLLENYQTYSPPEKSIFNIIRDTLFYKNTLDSSVVIDTIKQIRENLIKSLKDIDLNQLNFINKHLHIQPEKLTTRDNLESFKLKAYNTLLNNSNIIDNVYKIIINSSYNGNLFDAYILAELYKINIIILNKRRKRGESDHLLITPMNKVNEYIIVLKSNYDEIIIFESVIFRNKTGFQFVFSKNDLPIDFTNYVLVEGAVRTDEYKNYNYGNNLESNIEPSNINNLESNIEPPNSNEE